VATQRSSYKAGHLSSDRIRRLENIRGWTWDARAEQDDNFYVALESFIVRKGHARVPKEHIENGYPLGAAVGSRRQQKRNGSLSDLEIARCETYPRWTWDARASQWEDGHEALQAFYRREGHLDVPSGHRESGIRLASWMKSRRRDYQKKSLSPARILLLESVPCWTWGASRRNDVEP